MRVEIADHARPFLLIVCTIRIFTADSIAERRCRRVPMDTQSFQHLAKFY